jgi:RNA recognition motif-containing protein
MRNPAAQSKKRIRLSYGYGHMGRRAGDLIIPDEGYFSMAKKLYVGNLSYNTSEDGLRNLFSEFGNVASAKIIFDRETGNSKGFGFIEMSSDEEANAAMTGTNGREFDGRQLRVNEAMDKPRRDRGAGGYGGGNW